MASSSSPARTGPATPSPYIGLGGSNRHSAYNNMGGGANGYHGFAQPKGEAVLAIAR